MLLNINLPGWDPNLIKVSEHASVKSRLALAATNKRANARTIATNEKKVVKLFLIYFKS